MKINVLVTSAGGPAAISWIRSLRRFDSTINIIATDCNKLAAGLYLADHHYVIESTYKNIKNVIKKHSINLIIAQSEAELLLLSNHKDELNDMGVKTFVSSQKTIKICYDKLKFYTHCVLDFKLPSLIQAAFEKPDIGSGSRGVELIKAKEGNSLWEYLPGQEYTVDVFCNEESKSLGTVVRKRLKTKAGISVQGEVIRYKEIEKTAEDLCKFLNIIGPCCIQFKEDRQGIPTILECNPRLGGGSYFATLAGVNPAEIYVNLFRNVEVKKQYPNPITVTRYFEEIVI